MRYFIVLLLVSFNFASFAQENVTKPQLRYKRIEKVNFISTIDSAFLTKDGIYLNGYVVNIDYYRAKRLHGKTVRITGKAKRMTGLNKLPKGDTMQGREEDYQYIDSPKIEIIVNSN